MLRRSVCITFGQTFLVSLFLYCSITMVLAETRISTNYQLESDSINFSGGLSASDNYTLENTAGEIATGEASSTNYALKAGYQQMQQAFISMTAPTAVTLTPTIGGLTGGTANGSTSVVVLTDSGSGYELTIKADSAPAMQKGVDTIADYVPASNPTPDYSFITGSTNAHFGFSPEGTDIVARFKDNGAVCSTGSGDTTQACWVGLSTSDMIIAAGLANQPAGVATAIYFRVGIGGNVGVVPGEYIATTTLTALPI
jgi:hypothetical protein